MGWVRGVRLRGEDVTRRLLADEEALRRLYPAELFDPALIRTLGLIPSEYLFFYSASEKPTPTRGERARRVEPRLSA